MWKCFNRGVWETIDRSVNVFKADTSNGTCLLSSLAKDFDVHGDELVGSKTQSCGTDRRGLNRDLSESDVSHPQQAQCRDFNRSSIHNSECRSKAFSQNGHDLKAVTALQDIAYSSVPSFARKIKKRSYPGRFLARVVTSSNDEHTVIAKREVTCSCHGVPFIGTDCVTQSHRFDSGRRFYRSECSEVNTDRKSYVNSPSKITDVCSSDDGKDFLLDSSASHQSITSPFSPFLKPTISLDYQNVSGAEINLPKEEVQQIEALSSDSHARSNCVLELPFLRYDLGRFKGLNSVTLGWLMKPGSGFRRSDNGRDNRERSDESEETTEEAWRHCNTHQSFLEALGLSSAVLFGWFLGQLPFHHIHNGAKRDTYSERKCCIIKSLKRLLLTLKEESTLPLKILPITTEKISQDFRRKSQSIVDEREPVSTIEPYEQCCAYQPGKCSMLDIDDDNTGERCTSGCEKNVPRTENNRNQGNPSKLKLLSLDDQHKNVIPMPWHEDIGKDLVYGPITFEEAVQEASKRLEEVQAEVLLTLALEKLDVGGNIAENEPLPADLFQTSASLGSIAAAFNLGICYEKGLGGVKKNLAQAYHWYKQASERGHAAATYNMALFHANGLGGLHPNICLAKQLLLKASSMGSEEATNALQMLSSFNSSEISHNNDDYSSSVGEESLNQGSLETGDSILSHNIACSFDIISNRYDALSMYSKSYPLSGVSLGAVCESSEYLKKISNVFRPKIGHLFTQNHCAVNNSDADNGQLEEEIFEAPCLKSGGTNNGSIQLLAH